MPSSFAVAERSDRDAIARVLAGEHAAFEILVRRHTSSPDANPLFGGPNPVGIGVTGTFTDTAAVMDGTALVGKASQIFKGTLRKLADID